jgi:hypothetical protein
MEPEALDKIVQAGLEDPDVFRQIVAHKLQEVGKEGVKSFIPALFMLRVKQKPYSLKNHWMFEPMFSTMLPEGALWKCARQVGKCVSRRDLHKIRKFDGSPLGFDELIPGTMVLSMTDNKRVVPRTIQNVCSNGVKPVLRIKTRLGSEFHITYNHPLLTPSGYIKAEDLEIGGRLAACRQAGTFLDLEIDRRRIITTAFMIGDGSTTNPNQPELTAASVNSAVFEEVRRLFPEEHYSVYTAEERAPRLYWKAASPVRGWLRQDGLMFKYAWEKEAPGWVYALSKEDTQLFLGSLWATDGTMTTQSNGRDISYTTTSPKLRDCVSSLLTKLGILNSRRSRKTAFKGKAGKTAYVVRIEGTEAQREFVNTIHVPGKPPVDVPFGLSRSNRDTLPEEVCEVLSSLFETTMNKHASSLRSNGIKRLPKDTSITRHKAYTFLKLAEELDLDNKEEYRYLEEMLYGDITWDTITDIEYAGEEETFDIEMEEEHNFVLDGIISHNTQNLAASRLLKSIIMSAYSMLFVAPRFEQAKRISNDNMKPLINTSLFQHMFIDEHCDQSILHKTFTSESIQHYSFAFLDAERIRGVSVKEIDIDEVQDINWEFIPIIQECLSGSEDYRNKVYTGTPKSWDNTIQKLWDESSRAEWATRCQACTHWNIATVDHDLLEMIGPTTVVCSSCKRPIDPATGGWVHYSPARRPDFVGYHIPQVIHPFHYSKEKWWKTLLYKQKTYSNVKFYNECLGESCDSATRLMSITALEKLGNPQIANNLKMAMATRKRMNFCTMGIDWSGGGEDTKSYTAVCIAGTFPGSDVVQVIYCKRFLKNMIPEEEVREILILYKQFTPQLVSHDYGGAGNIREVLLIQAGIPPGSLIPFTYVFSTSKNIITYNKAKQGSRSSYSMDKPKSIAILCAMMKARKVGIPRYDTCRDEVNDFLNLIEEIQERPRGSDVYLISKAADTSDDMVHAINYACSSIWYTQQKYPSLLEAMHLGLTVKDMEKLDPSIRPLDPRVNTVYKKADVKDINPDPGTENWHG